jgi:hypothetical protein
VWRRGIHETDVMITPVPGGWHFVVSDFPIGFTPPDERIQCEWLPGVLGQIYLMRFP